MKLLLILFFCLQLSIYGQARLVDEFPKIPCGDFTARMDALLAEWERDMSRQIFVVYYGHRYRKHVRHTKNGEVEALILNFPHRDDGFNWAKGVPRYLSARAKQIKEHDGRTLDGIADKVKLIDGGFREEIWVEIWLAPAGAAPPKPKPTISEKEVTFRSDKPYPVPNQIDCYAGY